MWRPNYVGGFGRPNFEGHKGQGHRRVIYIDYHIYSFFLTFCGIHGVVNILTLNQLLGSNFFESRKISRKKESFIN
jgi:hypothetical protein